MAASRATGFVRGVLIGLLGVPAAAATEGSPEGHFSIEEVVVTAQRKPTTLLETPVAVSAYSGEGLDSRSIVDLRDLKTLVPGMQLGDSYGTAAITIRGIGTVEVLQGADPGVAYHVDGVYLGRAQLAATAFFDVAQIEVLRGSQGTLFGRNSTGGTINFIPNAPTDTFFSSIRAGFDTDPLSYQLEGVLSGPMGDAIRGRVSVQRTYNRGFSDNQVASSPGRLDDRDAYAARGQITMQLTDALEANLMVEQYDSATAGPAHYLLGTPAGDAPIGVVLGGTLPDIRNRKLYTNYGRSELEYTGAILKVRWEGSIGTLTSSTAYHRSDSRFVNDFDGTEVDFTSTSIDNDARQVYQEFILTASPTDRIDLVAGANVFDEVSKQLVEVPVNLPDLSLNIVIDSDISTRSYAGFMHLTYQMLDRLTAFGGLRYTYDDKRADRSNNFAGNGAAAADWGAVTYEAGLSVDVATSSVAYVKYAKGYKGGGFESSGPAAPPFDPEFSRSWEIGFKGEYFDRRAQVAISAFHVDYTDLQVNQIAGVSNTVTNAASATINGFEAEIAINPSRAISAELAFSHLDATFDEFMTADASRPALGILDLQGNRLRSSPKYSVSAGLFYTWAVGSVGEVTAGGRYYWQDRMYFSEFNVPISSQDGVGRGDFHLEYATLDERWKARMYVTNVADKTVFNDVVVVSDVLASSTFGKLDPGRRIGASITREF